MPNNNDLKSPKTDIESSPIRNLFKKNEPPSEDKTETQKNEEINTKSANPVNSENSKDKNKTERTDIEKEVKNKKTAEKTAVNTEEKSSDKTSEDESDIKVDLFESDNSISEDMTESSESETEKRSVFGKLRSKIKDIVMAMKQQPEEYDDTEIKDIFSTSGNFVREKNANPLDVDEEFKENVIYSAPKKEKTEDKPKSSETVISVRDIAEHIDKNKSDKKKNNDTNNKEAFEIIEGLQLKKSNIPEINTEKKSDKSSEKISETVKSNPLTSIPPKSQNFSETDIPVGKTEIKKPNETKTESDKSDNIQKVETVKSEIKSEKTSEKVSEAVKSHPLPPIPPKSKKFSEIDIPVGKTEIKKPNETKTESDKSDNIQKAETVKSEIKSEETSEKVSEAVKSHLLPPIPPKPKRFSETDIPVGKVESKKLNETKTKVVNNDKSEKNDNIETAKVKPEKQKENSEAEAIKTETKSEKNNKKDEIDDIKIIPWSPKNKDNKSNNVQFKNDNTDEKPYKNEILTYHYNKSSEPFIVMAGKFTRTVRNEYEEIRKYNNGDNEKNETEIANTDKVSKSEKSNNQPIQNKPLTISEVKSDKNMASPFIREVNSSNKTKIINKPIPSENLTVKNEIKEKNEKSDKQIKLNEVKPIVEQKNNSVVKKEKKKSLKKKDKKFNFKNIFSGDEEYDPDDDIQEVIEEKPPLDDYNEEKDAEEIQMEINENFRHIFIRTVILIVTSVFSIAFAVIAQCVPSLFNEIIRNGWLVYAIINFIIFAVSVVVSRVPIVNGLMPLRHFKGNSDTGIAVASFAAAIQSITALFLPDIFVNGTLYIYAPLVILSLMLNSMGKMLIILRVHDNFRFLTKPNVKFAGKIYTDINNAEKMTNGLPSRKPIIAYMKKSKFMSNFLKLSYAPDPSEEIASKIAPFATLFSIICGTVYGVITLDFAGAVSSFAISACITTPVCCLLAVNIPLKKLCRTSVKSGAMITGYETVKQFCDTNTVMVDVSQLYPKGTVTLSGMKTFKESKINDAIMAGAAIMFAVNGTMSCIFENIIQGKKDMLPDVESVIYEDGMGLVGWIGGQRVLIGNRQLLSSHNITPPSKDIEEKYRQTGNEIMYISMSGELIAMFIISYNPTKEIMHELRNLEDNGVNFIVRTVDPNITQEHIADKFSLFFRCIKILPTGLGNICHEVTSSVDNTSRAYLATRGKLSSFAKAVSGCIKIKSNVTLSIIIQYLAIAIGVLLVTLISFVSGFQKLGCFEMLLYIGFWLIATIIIPSLKK